MGDISAGMDRAKLDFLGQYALAQPVFRQQAYDPSSFQDTVEQDQAFLTALQQAGFAPLTREEMAFVSGWVQLADTQFGANDAALVAAIQAEIGNGGPNG